MTPQQRREDDRIHREYREYTEALAVAQARLDALAARNLEAQYNALYETEMAPIILNCKRSIGAELFAAAMRDAITLARISA